MRPDHGHPEWVSQGGTGGGGRLAALPLLHGPAVFRGFSGQDLPTKRHPDGMARLGCRGNPAAWADRLPLPPPVAGALRRSELRPERIFVHAGQFPRLGLARPAIPLVWRVVGEGVGVEETFRLGTARAVGDEHQLPRLVARRLAVPARASWTKSPSAGDALEECHSPQWPRIFSITAACGGSMKAITFIAPWHFGKTSFSAL